jgi:hypothetical protein
MGTVTFLAPANPQWVGLELKMMGVLRRLLGNESPFGWCDFITSTEPSGPCAEFCDHFGPVVRLTRVDTSLRGHMFTDRRIKTHN